MAEQKTAAQRKAEGRARLAAQAKAEQEALAAAAQDPLAEFRQAGPSGDTPAPQKAPEPPPMEFGPDPDSDADPLAFIVAQAVVAAASCWSDTEGAGDYDQQKGEDVAVSLIAALDAAGLLLPDRETLVSTLVETWVADDVITGHMRAGGRDSGLNYLAGVTASVILG